MTAGRLSAKADVYQLVQDSNYNDVGGEKSKLEYHNEARASGLKTMHDVSKNTPFKSTKTLENNMRTLVDVNRYIRAEYKCNTIRDIKPEMIESYLKHKIYDDGLMESTILRDTCPAINNLENMLNRIGVTSDFQSVLATARTSARADAEKPDMSSRSYGDTAESIIEHIKAPIPQFSCHLQLAYGVRPNESYKIHLTDQANHIIVIQKGGQRTDKEILPQDYNRLVDLSGGKTDFYISNYDKQQYHFAKACKDLGITSKGLHGLRSTYACKSYDRHRAEGMSDNEARAAVSKELGHERLEIVDTYLRGR